MSATPANTRVTSTNGEPPVSTRKSRVEKPKTALSVATKIAALVSGLPEDKRAKAVELATLLIANA
jgi:hypothetical protein